jgi:hypothetical protein
MELHVKRDEQGSFIDAEILNLSTEDWVIMHRSLKESLSAGKETLDYFQKSIEHKIERQYDLHGIEDTEKVIHIMEKDIVMLEKLVEAFYKPITTTAAITDTVISSGS